jgi:hypothetical protein
VCGRITYRQSKKRIQPFSIRHETNKEGVDGSGNVRGQKSNKQTKLGKEAGPEETFIDIDESGETMIMIIIIYH